MIKIGHARLIFYFLVFVLIFFVGRRVMVSVADVAGHYASYFLYPILVVQDAVVTPIQFFFKHCKSVKDLTQEVDSLRKSNESLRAELVDLKGQVQYFSDIKELLEFRKRYESNQACLGQILFKQFSEHGHFFLVNRGSSHGIKLDMIALYKNCLIGRVSEVYPWYCKVIAVTDRRCKVAAYCERSASCGIHQGTGSLTQTALKRISHLSTIYKGELIFSSGEGLIFPRGFALGRIKDISEDALWYQITVEPMINLECLSYCLLLHREAIN